MFIQKCALYPNATFSHITRAHIEERTKKNREGDKKIENRKKMIRCSIRVKGTIPYRHSYEIQNRFGLLR